MAFEQEDQNSGGRDVTNEQKDRTIAAYLEERRGYEGRLVGATEAGDEAEIERWQARVAEVDAELRRMGAGARTSQQTAEKRPSRRGSTKRGSTKQ